ncbi:FeoA family protein [Vibrio algivorus]|uniref:Ferrous iron transport protein A n=1 Tax=Vibrio algivorus TaxID=1667024 RepID=A0A557PAK2_9VIBR|nr:ferrous iron transport protein A [Vibrio algivorus]TVO37677.1 ferrous iron transport protein A [Vibrio algivorus]
MKLSELKMGQSADIVHLNALPNDIRKKLMIMGMLPNTSVTLIRKAPLGDPLQVEVRGVSLAIRGKVAEEIEIEVTNEL